MRRAIVSGMIAVILGSMVSVAGVAAAEDAKSHTAAGYEALEKKLPLQKAYDEFSKAIELDAQYTEAWIGRAEVGLRDAERKKTNLILAVLGEGYTYKEEDFAPALRDINRA